MINTRKSKRIKKNMFKKDIKIIKNGEGKVRKSRLYYLECIRAYVTIRLKQADIGRG